MTATHSAPFGFPHSMQAFLRRIVNLFAKTLLAVAIVVLAGLIAVATAAAGIALAAFALILRFSGSGARERPTRFEENAENGSVTLEAKKTPRGWTVE